MCTKKKINVKFGVNKLCLYVGRTSQRLQDRINQHIPKCIRSGKRPTKNLPNRECKITSTPNVYCNSAIGQLFLENEECTKHYNNPQFSILASARSSFHLSVLEATYINSLQPTLCRQKEFVYSLQISNNFFCAHFRLKRNNTFPLIKLPIWPIIVRRETFHIFALTLYYFRWFFAASYVIIATHCHFNVVNLYIYHCILVFLHFRVDSWRKPDENVWAEAAFFKATHFSKCANDSSDAIKSYFEILYH